MDTDPLHVLVIGATGNQGSALIRHLSGRGHRIRGMTRDPEKPKALALAQEGVEMVQGFLANPESVQEAAAGTDVAFLLTTPYGAAGPAGEIKQGTTAVDALARSGVAHIVYASVANADRETGIPHFDSKRRVEEHLLEMGMPFTVVAPVFFRENLLAPWCLHPGELRLPLPMERSLQNISIDEVGAFHAHVIEHHQDLMGERIDIASDENTPIVMADAIRRASDTAFRFQRVQYLEVKEFDKELARMYEWFDRVGFRVDIGGLRERFPEVPWTDFRSWAKARDWSMIQLAEEGAEDAVEEGTDGATEDGSDGSRDADGTAGAPDAESG